MGNREKHRNQTKPHTIRHINIFILFHFMLIFFIHTLRFMKKMYKKWDFVFSFRFVSYFSLFFE